jgi:hypothetical protein
MHEMTIERSVNSNHREELTFVGSGTRSSLSSLCTGSSWVGWRNTRNAIPHPRFQIATASKLEEYQTLFRKDFRPSRTAGTTVGTVWIMTSCLDLNFWQRIVTWDAQRKDANRLIYQEHGKEIHF